MDADGTKSRPAASADPPSTVVIDWFSEGETRTIEVAGLRIVVRFVGRKGRRGRISISAPAGAVVRAD